MQNRKRNTDVQNRLLASVGEREGGMYWKKSIETSILSRVKQIASPGWMHETGAQGWCTGKTQSDGMEREAGGGIGMGNVCKSMADSCQCMAKTTHTHTHTHTHTKEREWYLQPYNIFSLKYHSTPRVRDNSLLLLKIIQKTEKKIICIVNLKEEL